MDIVRNHCIHASLLLGGFALGIGAAHSLWIGPESRQFAIREYDQRYEFIRPLLICQTREDEETRELHALEHKVDAIISEAHRDKKISSASVYYRDLNSGQWMGINELETYNPASLLKVPIMIAYLKEAESDPSTLTDSYVYSQQGYEQDPLVDKPLLKAAKEYTALELIRGMIVQSDNPAMSILQSNANPQRLQETYAALEIDSPYDFDGARYQLSAKKYGLFFRVLYNGTFLDREKSNQALEMLSQSEFDLGIRAGTPPGVEIAHKHGVYGETKDGSHITEVSDCGIIYASSPYLLCIMSRGTNAYTLSEVIERVAETVYHDVIANQE